MIFNRIAMLVRKILDLLSILKPRNHKINQHKNMTCDCEATMGMLPHDITVEILARVTIESLLRFKCVCKSWRSLFISDSKFIQMYLSRSIERGCMNLLFASEPNFVPRICKLSAWDTDGRYYTERAVEIQNPFKMSFDRYYVLCSCNGLICMYRETSLCLYNPFTREYKFVRLENYKHYFSSDCSYGLGYDVSEDDYKFVRVDAHYLYPKTGGYEFDYSSIEIYSLKDSRCSATRSIPYQIDTGTVSAIFLNEAFHWVAVSKYNAYKAVISLGMKDKELCEVPLPYNGMNEKVTITLEVLKGKLCMLCKFYTRNEIEIWVMNNYGVSDSWNKICIMDQTILQSFQDRVCVDRFLFVHLRPLYIFNNGEILIYDGSVLVLYNPEENTSRNLEIKGVVDGEKIRRIVTYVESPVPLNSGTYA